MGWGVLNSQFSTLNSKFMSITSRLSTALADRYKIERLLGEGGMATVYLAEDLRHERKVAVKVLRPERLLPFGTWYWAIRCLAKHRHQCFV